MNGQINLDTDNLTLTDYTGEDSGHLRVSANAVNLELNHCVLWDLSIFGEDPARWRELAEKATEIAQQLEQRTADTSVTGTPSPARDGAGDGEGRSLEAEQGREQVTLHATETPVVQPPSTHVAEDDDDEPCVKCGKVGCDSFDRAMSSAHSGCLKAGGVR